MTGEMDQQLRVYIALAEDPNLVPMVGSLELSVAAPGYLTLWASTGICSHSHTHPSPATCIYIIKIKKQMLEKILKF